ncbi:MAG: hypothetical protein ABIC82_04625 [bacterium]
MENSSSQFNKRHPQKKSCDVGRSKRNRLYHRTSLVKSIGRLKKNEEETPIVAIQKAHLFRKQKAFLTKQAFVFEKKAEAVKEQVKEINKKIKIQNELASKLTKGLEDEYVDEQSAIPTNSKPDKVVGKKEKGLFRLSY